MPAPRSRSNQLDKRRGLPEHMRRGFRPRRASNAPIPASRLVKPLSPLVPSDEGSSARRAWQKLRPGIEAISCFIELSGRHQRLIRDAEACGWYTIDLYEHTINSDVQRVPREGLVAVSRAYQTLLEQRGALIHDAAWHLARVGPYREKVHKIIQDSAKAIESVVHVLMRIEKTIHFDDWIGLAFLRKATTHLRSQRVYG